MTIALLLLVSLVMVSGSCAREDATETVAELEGPVKVRWIYDRRYRKGHGLGAIVKHKREQTFLEIHSGAVIRYPVDCWSPSPQLAADKARSLVAYRCGGGRPWTLLHVSKTHAVRDPSADVGAAAQPVWSLAPDPERFALGALGDTKRCDLRGIFDAALERGGPPAVAKLVLAAADVRICGKQGNGITPWDGKLAELPPADQAALRAQLGELLSRHDVSHWFLRRVAAHGDLEPQERRSLLLSHISQRLDALAKAGASTADDERTAELESLAIALQRVAVRDRAAGAPLSCRMIGLGNWHRHNLGPLMDAFALVTYGGAPCSAVGQALASRYIGCWATQAQCPPARSFQACTAETLSPIVAGAVETAARRGGSGYAHDTTYDEEAVLAAALAQGNVPAWIPMAALRSAYTLDQPDSVRDRGVDGCKRPGMKSGTRCQCFYSAQKMALPLTHSLPQTLCKLDPGPVTTAEHEACQLEIDDTAKTITVLGRRSAAAGPRQSP